MIAVCLHEMIWQLFLSKEMLHLVKSHLSPSYYGKGPRGGRWDEIDVKQKCSAIFSRVVLSSMGRQTSLMCKF